jgi:hypothetical protein
MNAVEWGCVVSAFIAETFADEIAYFGYQRP